MMPDEKNDMFVRSPHPNSKGPNKHYVDTNGDVHIKLTQGKEALVSAEDYPKVAAFRWCAKLQKIKHVRRFYAWATVNTPSGRATLQMHVLIFEPGPSLEVDHMFGDGLDNRRGRTRNVNHRGNGQNRHEPRTSEYPGVSWAEREKKWRACIYILGRNKHLGYFLKEYDAFLAYRNKCIEIGVSCPDIPYASGTTRQEVEAYLAPLSHRECARRGIRHSSTDSQTQLTVGVHVARNGHELKCAFEDAVVRCCERRVA